MTYSVLGIDTTQVREIDPRTGKERPFYVPKINQQTGKEERVLLPKSSRLQGTYIIGATGTGKTGSLKNLAMQDIRQGIGICVLDPHGDLINDIIAGLSDKEVQRVILLDTLETEYQGTDYYPGLNIYQCDDPTNDKLAQETYERIKHIFNLVALANSQDRLGVRVSQGIRNSAFTCIDSFPHYGCTMLELPVLFGEDTPRANLITHLRDDYIRFNYWESFFNHLPKEKQREWADMVLNKVEGYTTNRLLRPIIGQSRTTINFRDVMNTGKILLIKLPGEHEEMTELLGSLVIAQILAAAFSRRDIRLEKRKQLNIYCDEFELYASDDFTRLLKECRKYGMAVTLAHQSRDFIDLKNKSASLQVANLIVLRIIRKDADEVVGNFDCTPIRTKKVLKQRTEPKYKEWDEYYWDSELAEQQFHELNQPIKDAYQQKLQAIIRAMCAQALSEHFRDAFSSKKWHHTPNYDGSSFAMLISLSNKDEGWYKEHKTEVTYYLHHPLNPAWMPFQGNGKASLSDIEAAERNLVLRDLRSETIHDSFYYWPDWWNGKPFYKKYRKRVDYSYLKREERYSFTGEAAISGVEYALQHGPWPSVITSEFPFWKGTAYSDLIPMKQEANALFRNLLDALITKVHEFVAPFYARLQLKFVPNLAPEMPWDRAKRDDPYCSDGWSPPEDGEVRYPHLANEPQPEIGQRRVGIGWTREGQWSTWKFEGAESWLINMEKRLEEQVKRSEKEVVDCENKRLQLLNEQQEFKSQHYKTAHRREYLGEQPVKEQQYRGEYLRITDVQWYDYTEELDQTPDQRRDEIANEIAMLPDYIARVKIKDKNDELVEYTIRTLAPERGLPEKALEERIGQIKAAMIENNIIRPKQVIDEEIRKRQQLLRLPTRKPSDTQEFLPPPEKEPPIFRRQQG